MTTYARDTFLWPIELDATNNKLVVVEDPSGVATELEVEPDAGTYYVHADATLHAQLSAEGDEHRGLYYAVCELLTSGTAAGVGTLTGGPSANDSYAVEVITPTASDGYTNGGLRIRAVKAGGATRFQLRFDQDILVIPWSTMDARWFGYKSAAGANFTSVADGDDEVLEMPHAIWGRLVTKTISPAGRAEMKLREPFKEVARSSNIARAPRVVWDEGQFRDFTYTFVWGALVYETRADEVEFATFAGLEAGDRNAAWELVWDSLTEGERVIVVHNSTDDFEVTTHDYEIGLLEAPFGFRQFATPTRSGGDFHTISFRLWIDPDFAEYPH